MNKNNKVVHSNNVKAAKVYMVKPDNFYDCTAFANKKMDGQVKIEYGTGDEIRERTTFVVGTT